MSKKPFKVAHLADIHWRSLARHAEYRVAFEELFEILKDTSPDVVVIAGDIVHSKIQGITPELIEMLSWWFRELSKLVRIVHVTLGNHDGLLHNKDRQDAITPILEALALPNVVLHKTSGAYETSDERFRICVMSCFDEEGWENAKPVDGKINIAVYHGAVRNSQTDAGWNLEGEIKCDVFKDYDMTMLGDIHKRQDVAYKNVEIIINEEDLSKYPDAIILEYFE